MSTMTTTQAHSCPFAAALDADDASSVQSGAEDGGGGGGPPAPPLPLQELRKCPAFQTAGGCPFREARSAAEVRRQLARVPPSHYVDAEPQGPFLRVIRQLHAVRPQDEAFALPGGCPVAPELGAAATTTFRDAMEDLSLAAVMARLAQQHEEEEDDDEEERDEAPGPLPTPVAPPPPVPLAADAASRAAGAPSPTLSQSLKTGTAASHQAAEDVHFVANFVKGKIDRRLYARLVAMLHEVYAALEDCLDAHAARHFASCHFPRELRRAPSLRDDLDFWCGDRRPEASPAARDYVDRLHAVARADPLLLLAHSYTRYLGDLSGGRILARVARRAMSLGGHGHKDDKDAPTEGLAFYHFAEIESPRRFKDQYRAALDALVLTPDQVARLVAEANVAFRLNIRLFEELDVRAGVPGATVRPLAEALASADLETTQATSNGADKCPFANLAKGAASATAAGHSGHGPASSIVHSGGGCPWPFLLLHDPVQGCRDWRTWAVAGLALCWIWSLVKP